MRYMVDGKEVTADEYDHAPAGKCKAVSSLDDDETIAVGLVKRLKAVDEGAADPCEADELLQEIMELAPDKAVELLEDLEKVADGASR